jgi:hypothetical protein
MKLNIKIEIELLQIKKLKKNNYNDLKKKKKNYLKKMIKLCCL